ncbi:MAG: HPr-rel-A system PqqD family peptide chaperone [Hahellaceae bacterium]|nr:HPr-rel-A system PqqD family peptide chaperone [Hahellaceae bacterium]
MSHSTEIQLQLDNLHRRGRVSALAISHNGFVFDPLSGQSFTVNDTALVLLQQLQQSHKLADIIQAVEAVFEVDPDQACRALERFTTQLDKVLL